MVWNPKAAGSTSQQDNQYGVGSVATVDSQPRTTSGNSSTMPTGGSTTLNLFVDVTAASGTTPSLAVSVEWSHDGTTWFTPDVGADTFAAVTAAPSKKVKTFTVKGPYFRVVWAITGTTPSFTFSVTAHADD